MERVHVHRDNEDLGTRAVRGQYSIGNFGGIEIVVEGRRHKLVPDSFRDPIDDLPVVHITEEIPAHKCEVCISREHAMKFRKEHHGPWCPDGGVHRR